MRLIKLISLVAWMLIAHACSAPTQSTITIGIPDGPSVISFIHMMEQAPMIEGKKIKWVVRSEPLQIQALMIQKKIDFAVLPTIMAANLYNKGVDYQLMGIPIWGTLYVITGDSLIQSMEDLQYKPVHIFGQGATADLLFQDYLRKHKLQKVKSDYTYTSNQELSIALMQEKIATAIVSEPLASMLLNHDHKFRVLHQLTYEDSATNNKNIFAQTAFLVSREFATEYPDITATVEELFAASSLLATEDLTSTANLLVKQGVYKDSRLALSSIPLCNIRYISAQNLKDELNQYFHFFYTFEPKSIGGKMPDQHFIYEQN